MNLFENLQKMNESSEIPGQKYILEIVKDGFETGHMPYDDFNEFSKDDKIISKKEGIIMLTVFIEYYLYVIITGI